MGSIPVDHSVAVQSRHVERKSFRRGYSPEVIAMLHTQSHNCSGRAPAVDERKTAGEKIKLHTVTNCLGHPPFFRLLSNAFSDFGSVGQKRKKNLVVCTFCYVQIVISLYFIVFSRLSIQRLLLKMYVEAYETSSKRSIFF